MEARKHNWAAIVICLSLLIGLPSAGALAARKPASPDKATPGKDKPEKGSKKKKEPARSPEEIEAEEFEASLKFQQGKITIKEGLATLNVPAGFRYLNPEHAERVLQAWGNPPGNTTLGMLFPAGVNVLGDGGWGVVISYQDDGYIKDDDAESINYADLMKEMKDDVLAENQERQQKGFEPVSLIGWAATPHYDRAMHKLYWAREIQFGDSDEHTLNYDVRVLGRKGILVLNAVASINQLSGIETSMQDIMGFVDFNDGNRYADFNPGVDKIAAYGIGALIAGKVLAKVGLFKLLIGFLIDRKSTRLNSSHSDRSRMPSSA